MNAALAKLICVLASAAVDEYLGKPEQVADPIKYQEKSESENPESSCQPGLVSSARAQAAEDAVTRNDQTGQSVSTERCTSVASLVALDFDKPAMTCGKSSSSGPVQ